MLNVGYFLIRCSVDGTVDADETGNRQVTYEQVDLSDWQSIRRLTQRVLQSETRLDVLINNAGKSVVHSRSQNDVIGQETGTHKLMICL